MYLIGHRSRTGALYRCRMTRTVPALIVLLATFALSACGSSDDSGAADDNENTTTTVSSSTNETVTTLSYAPNNCDDEAINGVSISAVVVRGPAKCADAKKIAALPAVKDKTFDFGTGTDYSCFYTPLTGSSRKYTCADTAGGIIEFSASN